jgi:hypothetical protein
VHGVFVYNALEIIKTLKLGRLRWLGHLTRANETSPNLKAEGGLEEPA